MKFAAHSLRSNATQAIDHEDAYVLFAAAFNGLAISPQKGDRANGEQDAREDREWDSERIRKNRRHYGSYRERDSAVQVDAVQVASVHECRTLPFECFE